MGSVAIISMYSFEVLPAPYNSLLLGGGAGLLTATVVASKSRGSKSDMVGEVGALPGMLGSQGGEATKPKAKSIEKARLLKRYDKAFHEMLSRTGPSARLETLEKMKPMIYELSPDIRAWTGDMRIRVHMLLKEIAKDLDDPAYAKASLGILVLILLKGGASAVEMARPMFRDKIHKMYTEPRFESERFLPRLVLMLDDYDQKALERLTKDAIHVWGDERFRAASGFLGLDTLRERGMRPAIKGLLGAEIARAGNEFDRTALNRAVELYHEVR